jgi:hypothetical protein
MSFVPGNLCLNIDETSLNLPLAMPSLWNGCFTLSFFHLNVVQNVHLASIKNA